MSFTIEVEHILKSSQYIKKTFEGRKEAVGETKNRIIKVEFIELESYINVITVI